MGLSENEQRILQELEHQLRAEDPGLERRVSRYQRGTSTTHALLRAGILFLVGLGLLLLLTFSPVPAIIGTGVMLFAIVDGAKGLSAMAKEQAQQHTQKASQSDDA